MSKADALGRLTAPVCLFFNSSSVGIGEVSVLRSGETVVEPEAVFGETSGLSKDFTKVILVSRGRLRLRGNLPAALSGDSSFLCGCFTGEKRSRYSGLVDPGRKGEDSQAAGIGFLTTVA